MKDDIPDLIKDLLKVIQTIIQKLSSSELDSIVLHHNLRNTHRNLYRHIYKDFTNIRVFNDFINNKLGLLLAKSTGKPRIKREAQEMGILLECNRTITKFDMIVTVLKKIRSNLRQPLTQQPKYISDDKVAKYMKRKTKKVKSCPKKDNASRKEESHMKIIKEILEEKATVNNITFKKEIDIREKELGTNITGMYYGGKTETDKLDVDKKSEEEVKYDPIRDKVNTMVEQEMRKEAVENKNKLIKVKVNIRVSEKIKNNNVVEEVVKKIYFEVGLKNESIIDAMKKESLGDIVSKMVEDIMCKQSTINYNDRKTVVRIGIHVIGEPLNNLIEIGNNYCYGKNKINKKYMVDGNSKEDREESVPKGGEKCERIEEFKEGSDESVNVMKRKLLESEKERIDFFKNKMENIVNEFCEEVRKERK